MTLELSPEVREQGGYRLVNKLISSRRIAKTNQNLGLEISRDYKDKNPLFIVILNGAVIFGSDLMKYVNVGPAGFDTMAISSYGDSTETNYEPKIIKDTKVPINGRHVILVEDIVDTGWSLTTLVKQLEVRNPESLSICTLLNKSARREADIEVNYIGLEIPNKFVVGYGLDVAELFRLLPDIWVAEKIPTT